MPYLEIELQGSRQQIPLPDGRPVTIGSAEGCDLRLGAEGVAPTHCRLDPLPDGRWRLKDLDSGRETRVDGVAAKQLSLSDGARIQIGSLSLTYSTAAGAAPRAPSTKAVPAKAVPARAVPAQSAAASAGSERSAAGTSPSRTRPASRATSGNRKLVLPLVALVVAGVAAFLLSKVDTSDPDVASPQAEASYREAVSMLDRGEVDAARDRFAALAIDPDAGHLRERAQERLDTLANRSENLDERLERLKAQRLDLTETALQGERKLIIADHGEGAAARFDELATEIRAEQARWKADMLAVAQAEARTWLDQGRYAKALEHWRSVKRNAPFAISLDDAVEAGRQDVETAAAEGWRKLARQLKREKSARIRAGILGRKARAFRGTAVEGDLLEALRVAQAAAVVTPTVPEVPEAGPVTPTPATPPGRTGPPRTGAAWKALEDQVAGHVATWDFAGAAQAIRDAGTLPSDLVGDIWRGRLADLERAVAAFEDLARAVETEPARYTRAPLTARVKGDLLKFTPEAVVYAVRGGESRMTWDRVEPTLLPVLVKRRRAKGDVAAVLASLLHVRGHQDAAERLLFRAGQDGVDPATLFPRLALWRQEALPAEGYVEHEERWVTPAQRDALLLEAAVQAALVDIGHKDAKKRAAAYRVLLDAGEVAAERFRDALEAQRLGYIDTLAKSKRFTSSKVKGKLYTELESRRRKALALIRDAQAYPYPNPNKRNQKEVEALVDLVREVWERPFDLIASWDKKLSEDLALLTEIDEMLVQVDPDYRPDLDELKERVNVAVDMPAFTPNGRAASLREYSLKVLAFNETLKTTAIEQEKDNTRAVNEYRMMMGIHAVRIEERLLRGARGHSRHMMEHRYFAHNVPGTLATKTNRTPGDRARFQGYGGGVGENIAMGPGTGRGAFWAWFGSSGHHRNMLAGWTEMGCGKTGHYWTQLFGSVGGRSLSTPDPLPAPDAHFAPEPEPAARQDGNGGQLPDDEPPGSGAFR